MTKADNPYERRINNLISCNLDISHRIIKGCSGEVCMLFIKQLTDRDKLSNQLLRPLMHYVTNTNELVNPNIAMSSIILAESCKLETQDEMMIELLLEGMTIIIFPNVTTYIVVEIKSVAKKSIQGPELTFTLKGGRDSFIENLDSNLSLIRYRIKDPNLQIQYFRLGRRTKTRIAITYIADIVNKDILDSIVTKLNQIDTDGIIASGELQNYLLNNKFHLFPQTGLVERSDMACGALLEGKVIIITEGSGIALIAPKTFGEFLWSSDDNYDSPYFGLFTKCLRMIAVFFSISLSAAFIIVTSFNFDLLPPEYIITLSSSRSNVPFNPLTGVILLEIIIEILRESLLRVPKQIGAAVGIVGATIIGQAAISSGIFSPLLLILSSLSFLSSFAVPDFTITNPLRIMKFILIFLSGFLGIFGFTFGLCFLATNIISTNSFGVAYLSPLAPFNLRDFKKMFFYNNVIGKTRPRFLRTKDKQRTKE